MKYIKGLFSEQGNTSLMRVMALLSLVAGIVLAFLGKNESVATLVCAAFGGKALQRFIEAKDAPPAAAEPEKPD